MKTTAAMNILALILGFSLLSAVPLLARENTDVIIMKNGDHLTGQIKGLSSDVLYFGLPYVIQTLSVDWSQVAQLKSKQLFLVKTQDGSVYRGVLNSTETPVGRPLEIQVSETPENKVALDSSHIVEVDVTSEKFFQRFTGGVNFGTIYSKGNQSVQYNISGLAAYPRERWEAQVGISSNLSAASGTSASTHNQLTLGAMHLLPWNNYFYAGFDGFLQSSEQGIAHQNYVGGGIGRYLKNTDRATITLLGGLAWQNTVYNPTIIPIATQNVATGVISTDVKLFKFNKTNLDLNAVLLPVLSQAGRVYFSTNASYYIKITGSLSWNLSFYGNWDTRPPGNLPGSDYGTTSGLSWTFGSSLRTAPTTLQ
jgi:Protein of unknown function, DUF481